MNTLCSFFFFAKTICFELKDVIDLKKILYVYACTGIVATGRHTIRWPGSDQSRLIRSFEQVFDGSLILPILETRMKYDRAHRLC